MFLRFLYAAVAVLVVILGWQFWGQYQVNGMLEKNMAAQSHGASEKDAKVTIVAFMDYSCRSCKATSPILMQLATDYPDIRVIFRPLPDGENNTSIRMARFALAAAKQGKFIEAHEELMRNERPVTGSLLDGISERLGLDHAQMARDAESEDVTLALDETLSLFRRIGLVYTPSLLINRQTAYVVIQPDRAYNDLLQLITKERLS